jgi:hypothetical protein
MHVTRSNVPTAAGSRSYAEHFSTRAFSNGARLRFAAARLPSSTSTPSTLVAPA